MDLRVWQGFSLPSDLCLLQPHFHTVNNLAIRYSGYSTATITINHINIPRAAEYSRLRTIKLSLSLRDHAHTSPLYHEPLRDSDIAQSDPLSRSAICAKTFASSTMSGPNATHSTAVPSTHSMGMFHRIPCELREMIFQYLLDARYTKLKRRTRDNPAYKFHTNILAVNRAIYAEAEQLLAKRNTFVTASHTLQLDDARQLMRDIKLWVPLVASKSTAAGGWRHYTATMKYSSLKTEFTYSPDGIVDLSDPADHSAPLQEASYVFLAADLISYCSVLSARMYAIDGPRWSSSGEGHAAHDKTLHPDGRVLPSASLAITLSNSILEQATSRGLSIISPFRNAIAPSLRVAIEVSLDGRSIPIESSAVEDFRRHMGPSLMCIEAAEWAFFERYETRKAIADSTALGGELNLALAMYEDMMSTVAGFFTNPLRFPRHHSYCAIFLLGADLRMTKAHIHCKLGDRAAFKATIILSSKMLHCYREFRCDFSQQPGVLDWIKRLIITAVLGPDGDVDDVPLRCVDLRRTSGLARKPRHYVGWIDLRDLSQTDEKFRTDINGLQRERGLPLTDFRWFGREFRRQCLGAAT